MDKLSYIKNTKKRGMSVCLRQSNTLFVICFFFSFDVPGFNYVLYRTVSPVAVIRH